MENENFESMTETMEYQVEKEIILVARDVMETLDQTITDKVNAYLEQITDKVNADQEQTTDKVNANQELWLDSTDREVRWFRHRLKRKLLESVVMNYKEDARKGTLIENVFETDNVDAPHPEEYLQLKMLMMGLGHSLGKAHEGIVDEHVFHSKRIIAAAAEYYSIPVNRILAHNITKEEELDRNRMISFLCYLTEQMCPNKDMRHYHSKYEKPFDFKRKYSFAKVDALTDAKEILIACSRM